MLILLERRYRSLGHVFICDGGPLGTFTLPKDFTDRGRPPRGSPVDADLLSELVAVVSALRKPLTGNRDEE